MLGKIIFVCYDKKENRLYVLGFPKLSSGTRSILVFGDGELPPLGEFALKRAYEVANELGYTKTRTVRHWLTRFVQDGHLTHKEHGRYVKDVQPSGFTPHFRLSALFQNGQEGA